jgi:hypothetical protein
MEPCGGDGRKRGRVKGAGGDEEEEPGAKRRAAAALVPWAAHQHPASRIYRVSRASGGKDRHSKVYTAKGIRDRRVRLSVATAIQFYDLQDRLGCDQPSKAIDWLIKAAADAIDKLPSLDAAAGFPSHPASSLAAAAANNKDPPADAEEDPGNHHQLTRSGCSSTSETSKGSVLSLSRSESRVKARERARERSAAAAKDPPAAAAPTTSSFTELLTGMAAAEHKQQQPSALWMPVSATTADYIGFAQPPPHAFASPTPHLGVAPAQQQQQHFAGQSPGAVTVASAAAAEMTHFSFLQDHFMPAAAVHALPSAGDYNLNFSMPSGLVGASSRGTLQSNSHISGHQLQRLSAPLDAAPNIPFLFSPAAAPAAAPDTQLAAFQLWNGFHHHAADIKEKGKN